MNGPSEVPPHAQKGFLNSVCCHPAKALIGFGIRFDRGFLAPSWGQLRERSFGSHELRIRSYLGLIHKLKQYPILYHSEVYEKFDTIAKLQKR